jgi:hypothetical protein
MPPWKPGNSCRISLRNCVEELISVCGYVVGPYETSTVTVVNRALVGLGHALTRYGLSICKGPPFVPSSSWCVGVHHLQLGSLSYTEGGCRLDPTVHVYGPMAGLVDAVMNPLVP